jgi:hypothetical protein
LQWVADTHTVKIFSQSPKRDKSGIASPFTSPHSQSRGSIKDVTSPASSTKPSMSTKRRSKRSMYQTQCSTENLYKNNVHYDKNNVLVSQSNFTEVNDHEDDNKDRNDDLEIEQELDYTQNFIPITNPNNSMQGEKSFDSRYSEGAESINTNNYSFLSYGKSYSKV